MNLLRDFATRLSRGLDDVVSTTLSASDLFRRAKKVSITERDDQLFNIQDAGGPDFARHSEAPSRFVDGRFEDADGRLRSRLASAEVEIVLAPRRFMFRTLELPKQASGFLDAIVRAQIDRLTPWSAAHAVFGCGAPVHIPDGRLEVTIAATARNSLMPLVAALERLGPNSIIVSTYIDAGSGVSQPRIVVFAQQTNFQSRALRARRILVAIPALMAFVAVAAMSARVYVDYELEAARLRVSQQMAERRGVLAGGHGAEAAVAALARRKRETSPDILVLESLSRALPDDTYLIGLQVQEGKLQISGVTREASSLIKLIEQTNQFRHAAFFAPTTSAPGGGGEQFHIEAQIAAPVEPIP